MIREPKEIIILDGVRIELTPPDLDGDGITGGTEVISSNYDQGLQPVIQPTELGDSLHELNKDDLEDNTRMSAIDMRARLHHIEAASLLALDSLVALRVLPTDCLAFSRQKKRLSVSLNGLGRQEIVEVVGGKREMDAKLNGGGLGDKLKGFMGMNR